MFPQKHENTPAPADRQLGIENQFSNRGTTIAADEQFRTEQHNTNSPISQPAGEQIQEDCRKWC